MRSHPRARNVRLRVSVRDGLVVTLPAGAPHSLAAEAVSARLEWSEAGLARVRERREALLATSLPEEVAFAATGESWAVRPVASTAAGGVVEKRGELSVPVGDGGRPVLRRWLSKAARRRLEPWLLALAEEHGVDVPKVTVRCQRSRWGSRSAGGTISLNRNLVFLPGTVARSVLLHELCHAHHLDHSPAFRERLASMDVAWRESREALRDGESLVPAWALLP